MKRPHGRGAPFRPLATIVIASACAGTARLEVAEGRAVPAPAGDEDEVWGFLPKPTAKLPPAKPESEEPREKRPRRPVRPRRRRVPRPRPRPRIDSRELAKGFVVRGGVILTVSAAEGAWEPAGALGVGYRWSDGSASKVIYDFGVDVASVERSDGLVSSDLYSFRGEVLFGDWSVWRSRTVVYLLGGAHAVLADSDWESDGSQRSSTATGFEFGVGMGSGSGRWDVRLVYSFLAGSGNVKGNILVAAGFSL